MEQTLTTICGNFKVETELKITPENFWRKFPKDFSCPKADTSGGYVFCKEANLRPCPVYSALTRFSTPNGHFSEGETKINLEELPYYSQFTNLT